MLMQVSAPCCRLAHSSAEVLLSHPKSGASANSATFARCATHHSNAKAEAEWSGRSYSVRVLCFAAAAPDGWIG